MKTEQINIALRELGFEDFLDEKVYISTSSKTIENYKYSLVNFLKYLIENSLSAHDIEPKIIMKYFKDMQSERSWSEYTKWTQMKNLRAYFNWCVKKEIMRSNPILEIPRIKQPQQPPKALYENELVILLDELFKMPYKFHFTKLRDIALVSMFLYAGLRNTELRSLTVSDVDLKNGFIRVQHGKGDKYREVPIQESALKPALEVYLQYRNHLNKTSKWFFNGTFTNRGYHDNQLTAAAIGRVFKKLKIKTGIKVGAHRLRHSFATLHLDKNGDIYTLKELMGHTDISTTCIYLSVVRRKKVESINKMVLPSLSNITELIV